MPPNRRPATKRRGRPPSAPKEDIATRTASEPDYDELGDNEIRDESGLSKKRKRRSRGEQQSISSAQEEVVPRNPGRRKSAVAEETAQDETVQQRPRRRGRSSNVASTSKGTENPEEVQEAQKRKPGRPRRSIGSEATPSVPQDPEPNIQSKRRRGRPSLGTAQPQVDAGESIEQTKEQDEPPPKRKRGPRPRKSDVAAKTPTTTAPDIPRDSATGASIPDDLAQRDTLQSPKRIKKRVAYRHIAPRIRQVPHSVIEEKWSPLEPPSIAAVTSLLLLAERPVLQRLAGSSKRLGYATSAIRTISRRLANKLSRGLPFPPAGAPAANTLRRARNSRSGDAGREEELDFERTLDAVRALEQQLDPLLHSIVLLEAEKQVLEKDLKRDYEIAQKLESNARSEAGVWREKLRKAHTLTPVEKSKENDTELEVVRREGEGGLFQNLPPPLEETALQLAQHASSLQTNIQQIDGVAPEIASCQAALRAVLARHLDEEKYEKVVLG